MHKTYRLLALVGLVFAFAGIASAEDLEGVLMDKMCSMKALSEGGEKAALMHTRSCALMPDCVKSGYGVITSGNKFIALDAEGNKKAEKALKASKKQDGIRVKVTGERKGEVFAVKALTIL